MDTAWGPSLIYLSQSGVPWERVNPLSPNSDQHQFSPNNIHMLPREMVIRINKVITKEKSFDLLSKSLN